MSAVNFARPRSRYPHTPLMVDGIQFASKAEAARWGELKLLERARQITDLVAHPRFALHAISQINGERIECATYTADFGYSDRGRQVIEDVKSPASQRDTAYRLRKRWFEAEYGIQLTEVIR